MKNCILIFIFVFICQNALSQGSPESYRTALNCNCKQYGITVNNFKWEGGCKDGYTHGYGNTYFSDKYGNTKYKWVVGSYWYGKRQGYCTIYSPEGNIIAQGNFLNDMLNGIGTFNYPNGDTYIGNFEDDVKTGHGKYTFSNGNYYEGNFINDEITGYGKGVFSNTVLEGYYDHGKFVKNNSGLFYFIPSTQYGNDDLAAGKNAYLECYVPANTLGVFTLKNKSATSDLDIYIYADEKMYSNIGSGLNSGITTELVTVPIESHGRLVYIKLVNKGRSTARYNFYPHNVNIIKKGEEALIEAGAEYLLSEGLKWIFGINEGSQNYSANNKNAGQASAIIISALKGNNLGAQSKYSTLNKVSLSLKAEFGNSFWGNVFVNFANNILTDVYQNY